MCFRDGGFQFLASLLFFLGDIGRSGSYACSKIAPPELEHTH